jgi:hypothetical protein
MEIITLQVNLEDELFYQISTVGALESDFDLAG